MADKEYITNDYENIIEITYPENRLTIEEFLDGRICPNGTTFMTNEDIDKYFNMVLNDDARVSEINGLRTNMFCDAYYCDYCPNAYCGYEFYHCYNCYKDMCKMCFEETTEEIAKSHGATKWHLRKDNLAECRVHDIDLINIMCAAGYCEICNERVAPCNTTFMYKNDDEGSDVCVDCYQKLSEEDRNGYILTSMAKIYDNTKFGSVMDWIPFCQNTMFDYLLVNRNKDSINYLRFACAATDNHGRSGYFILPQNTTYNSLLESINTLHNEDELYETSIKLYMLSLGLRVHFG